MTSGDIKLRLTYSGTLDVPEFFTLWTFNVDIFTLTNRHFRIIRQKPLRKIRRNADEVKKQIGNIDIMNFLLQITKKNLKNR